MAFESFAQQFAALGGRRIFGVPGGGPSLELITQMEKNGGSFIATGHEAVAGLMAGAYARQTNQPAACVTIKGPGFMNLSPGLLCNSYEGYPCLSISEAYPPNESTGRRHKWLNHLSVGSEFLRGIHGFSEEEGKVANLWNEAVGGGAQACGAKAAGLQVGADADWLVIDENDPTLAAASLENLMGSWLFAPARQAPSAGVGGRAVTNQGRHAKREAFATAYRDALLKLAQ